jgi:hypothetical protein
MEWIIAAVVIFIIYKVIVKDGNLDFWKLVQSSEEDQSFAYHLFTSHSAWYVCNNDKPADIENWDGPFKFPTLDGQVLTIYGKVGEYEKTQEEFVLLSKMRK